MADIAGESFARQQGQRDPKQDRSFPGGESSQWGQQFGVVSAR
jgi:hypothetical protein